MLTVLAPLTLAALLATNPTPDAKPLVVHEWGTFTSFSGPGIRHAPHQTRIADDLPAWVQARFVGDRWFPANTPDFTKAALRCTHRMETPVIYFHTDQPAQVSVEVRMPEGLITEVYPPVTSTRPLTLPSPEIPKGGSMVRWDNINLVPSTTSHSPALKDAGTSHYAHARNTNSAFVHTTHNHHDHAERFLFYRGVGNMNLGLSAEPLGNDRFRLDTNYAFPTRFAFIIERKDGKLRFSEHHNVPLNAELSLPAQHAPEDQLAHALTTSLATSGLNPDEAAAMVATWRAHWFGEEGTRLLVSVPQPIIDIHLPLAISPTPAQTTRVFVSRLELLTPERKEELRKLLTRKAETPDEKAAIEAELKKLGRFRDAAIQMVDTLPVDGC